MHTRGDIQARRAHEFFRDCRRVAARLAIGLAPYLAVACGSGSNTALVDVAVTPNGVVPKSVKVDKGGTVRFTNADIATHQIAPLTDACPELRGPVMTQGQSFSAMMANVDKTCQYQDALQPDATTLRGSIVVGSSTRTATTSTRP